MQPIEVIPRPRLYICEGLLQHIASIRVVWVVAAKCLVGLTSPVPRVAICWRKPFRSLLHIKRDAFFASSLVGKINEVAQLIPRYIYLLNNIIQNPLLLGGNIGLSTVSTGTLAFKTTVIGNTDKRSCSSRMMVSEYYSKEETDLQ